MVAIFVPNTYAMASLDYATFLSGKEANSNICVVQLYDKNPEDLLLFKFKSSVLKHPKLTYKVK